MSDQPAPGGAKRTKHLFDSERQQIISTRNLDRHTPFREDSINWILERHGHYRFSPATAHRAVAYFDQFMSTYTTPAPETNAWRYRMLAAACLLVAAKVGEADVQVPDAVHVQGPVQSFFAETVEDMESVVRERLQMDIHRVTPFDFLDCFISRLPGVPLDNNIAAAFADLIMNTIRAGAFLRFLPSEVAAAAVIIASGVRDREELPIGFYRRVDEFRVGRCREHLEWYAVNDVPLAAPLAFMPLAVPLAVAPPAGTDILALLDAPFAAGDSTTCDTGSGAREDNKHEERPAKKLKFVFSKKR